MDKSVLDKNSKDYLEFCYKEYVRLAKIQESHLHSAFSDMKMLSAVGGMLAWKPLIGVFAIQDTLMVLSMGFIALLVVVLLIFLFDFIRQSIMLFYTDQLKHYEAELRGLLDLDQGAMFSSISNWAEWMSRFHEPIVKCFFTCLLGFVIFFPTLIILSSSYFQISKFYALSYFLTACVLCGFTIYCLNVITAKISEKLKL